MTIPDQYLVPSRAVFWFHASPALVAERCGEQVARGAADFFWGMSVVEDAMTAVSVGVRDAGVTAMHDATECGVWGASTGSRGRRRRMRALAEQRTVASIVGETLPVDRRKTVTEGGTDRPLVYRDWLATYADSDFAAVGLWLRGVVDDEATRLDATERQRLLDIFRTSSRYEYLFWQMAWTRESWPLGEQ